MEGGGGVRPNWDNVLKYVFLFFLRHSSLKYCQLIGAHANIEQGNTVFKVPGKLSLEPKKLADSTEPMFV